MRGFHLCLERDKAHLVRLPYLFKRPANARIARQTRAAVGRSLKRGDDDGHRSSCLQFSAHPQLIHEHAPLRVVLEVPHPSGHEVRLQQIRDRDDSRIVCDGSVDRGPVVCGQTGLLGLLGERIVDQGVESRVAELPIVGCGRPQIGGVASDDGPEEVRRGDVIRPVIHTASFGLVS